MSDYSICVIARNEEKRLPKFLDSIKSFNCEKIFLDTGSTDATVKIAISYDCTVKNFTWINDFAAARNYAMSLASNDMVLFLDCDEYVDEVSPVDIGKLIDKMPSGIGLIKRINLTEEVSLRGSYTDYVPRLFNRNIYEYKGQIHEQVCPQNNNTALEGYYIPLTVIHDGYLGTPEEKAKKHIRNLSLLLECLDKDPLNQYYNFQVGTEYYNSHKYRDAIPYFRVATSYPLDPEMEYHRLSLMGFCDCLLHENMLDESLQTLLLFDPNFANCPDYFYLRGLVYFNKGDFLHAMSDFISATTLNNPHKEGTNTWMPWFHIARINELLGNTTEAITFYKMCGDLKPAIQKIKELT